MDGNMRVVLGLPLGTEYVVIDNQVRLLGDMRGQREMQCFYPAGMPTGYLIRRRERTQRELHGLKGEYFQATSDGAALIEEGLWK